MYDDYNKSIPPTQHTIVTDKQDSADGFTTTPYIDTPTTNTLEWMTSYKETGSLSPLPILTPILSRTQEQSKTTDQTNTSSSKN